MVAYNFQAQFCDAIASGKKTHTIRRLGKRRHARPGEQLQLYTAQRTRQCRKIVDDRLCVRVATVDIYVSESAAGVGIDAIYVDGVEVENLDRFARADGFGSLASMAEFWHQFHGVGRFTGVIIFWTRERKAAK